MNRPRSERLVVALAAVALVGILVYLGAYLRTGQLNWAVAITRTAVLIVLSVLAIRRHAWARWTLIAWLGLGVVLSFGYFPGAAGLITLQLVLVMMLGLHVWAIVELALDRLGDPTTTTV